MTSTKHTVYFEIFGKKLKVTIDAVSRQDAEDYVRNSIVFHKVVASNQGSKTKVDEDEIVKFFKGFGMFL